MTDEHIVLTERGVWKARVMFCVKFEERFVTILSKKVRTNPWNGAAERLQAPVPLDNDANT